MRPYGAYRWGVLLQKQTEMEGIKEYDIIKDGIALTFWRLQMTSTGATQRFVSLRHCKYWNRNKAKSEQKQEQDIAAYLA